MNTMLAVQFLNMCFVSSGSGARTDLAEPVALGGCVDTDEDEVGLYDGRSDFRREKQVLAATSFHNFLETRLQPQQTLLLLCND